MVAAQAGPGPITVDADFVMELREVGASRRPDTAGRRSPIDRRTTRDAGYRHSRQARHRMEQVVHLVKIIAGQSRTKHRGLDLASAAYNLIRLPKLLATAP
jgi:hypothetical protein